MKINTNGITNPSINAKDAAPAIAAQARASGAASTIPSADRYVPSAEWLRLQALLHQQPEVRSDRVAQASERLQSGYYLTAESAQNTADAMLASPD